MAERQDDYIGTHQELLLEPNGHEIFAAFGDSTIAAVMVGDLVPESEHRHDADELYPPSESEVLEQPSLALTPLALKLAQRVIEGDTSLLTVADAPTIAATMMQLRRPLREMKTKKLDYVAMMTDVLSGLSFEDIAVIYGSTASSVQQTINKHIKEVLKYQGGRTPLRSFMGQEWGPSPQIQPSESEDSRPARENTSARRPFDPAALGVASLQKRQAPRLEEGPLAWQADSLCAQTDPEVFFPESGGSTRNARKVCANCEVRQRCLDYALENDEVFGIWGGLNREERLELVQEAS